MSKSVLIISTSPRKGGGYGQGRYGPSHQRLGGLDRLL